MAFLHPAGRLDEVVLATGDLPGGIALSSEEDFSSETLSEKEKTRVAAGLSKEARAAVAAAAAVRPGPAVRSAQALSMSLKLFLWKCIVAAVLLTTFLAGSSFFSVLWCWLR